MCTGSGGTVSVYIICSADGWVSGRQGFQAPGVKHFPSPSLDFLCLICCWAKKKEIVLRCDSWKILTLGRRKIKRRWPTWVLLRHWIDLQTAALWASPEEQLWASCSQRAVDNCWGGWGRLRIQQNPHRGCRYCPRRLSGNTVKSTYHLETEDAGDCHLHF